MALNEMSMLDWSQIFLVHPVRLIIDSGTYDWYTALTYFF